MMPMVKRSNCHIVCTRPVFAVLLADSRLFRNDPHNPTLTLGAAAWVSPTTKPTTTPVMDAAQAALNASALAQMKPKTVCFDTVPQRLEQPRR
jgi:hypothetical protein